MSTLFNRLKALETAHEQPMRDVRKMTDAELLQIIGLGLGEREPTDAELLAIIKGEQHNAAT